MESDVTVTVQDKQFSYFENPITNVKPKEKPLTISRLYNGITSAFLKEATMQIRAESDRTKRNNLKNELLPYVTFSGTFTHRADSGLINHSGLICIDIDHIGDAHKNLKNQVTSTYPPALMFRSPSGDGIKVVYQVDITQDSHLQYFSALQNFYKQEFNINIDKAAKDVSRACFLCHDPEAFTSSHPVTLTENFTEQYTNNNNIIGLGKAYLERKGISFQSGGRNDYVMQLAAYCHRAGMPYEDVYVELIEFQEPDFPIKEIEGIIRSIYKNESFAGIAVKPTEQKTKSTKEIPPFPIETLPSYLKDLVSECHYVYGTPLDYWAGAILAAISTAIGNSITLRDGKFYNNSALWFAFVGQTGIGKTEPLSFALKPFHRLDEIAFKEYSLQASIFEEYKSIPAKERQDHTSPDKPILHQYLLGDFTPEALAQVHRDNPRGIMVHRDELMGWINDFNRYNKSGEVQNWLSIWSGQPVTYNRKSQNPLKITHPCISIAGCVQPELLQSMGADHRTENGLMQRFCFLYPDRPKKPYYSQNNLPKETEENYDRFINTLLSIPMNERNELNLSKEAQNVYRDFVNQNTDAINRENKDYVRGIFSKLDIIALRLSINLHLASAVLAGELEMKIDGGTMQAAIMVTEYFRETSIKVYDHFSHDVGMTKAAVAKYLYHKVGYKNQTEIAQVLKVTQPYINKVIRL